MRDIKYKAYDKKENCIFDVARIDIADGSCYSHLFASDIYDYWNNIELLEYTGYKDINDVEIYEGYIVETTRTMNRIVGVVTYYKAAWYIKTKEGNYIRLIPRFGVVENRVIGNIYENKSLLEED